MALTTNIHFNIENLRKSISFKVFLLMLDLALDFSASFMSKLSWFELVNMTRLIQRIHGAHKDLSFGYRSLGIILSFPFFPMT